MVKVQRTAIPPASLAIEKAKPNGSCKERDVIEQLSSDFHDKCYLCEMDELQSIEVEHLRPHHNGKDRERMFDWNNLFYSCAHCNSVKNRKQYEEDVADCCIVDPEEIIQQEFLNGKVCVTPLVDTAEAKTTASLVEACFELRNTAIREKECQTKVRALQHTMTVFYKQLENYKIERTEKTVRTLKAMLSRSYKFSGFTRAYIKMQGDAYPELQSFLN